MRKLAIIGCIAGAVIVLGLLLLPVSAYDWGWSFECRFHIIDSKDSRPVRGAGIRVIRDSQFQDFSDTNYAGMFPVAITDSNGVASVSVRCGAGGSQGLFGKTGQFVISHELLIEADGYRPLSTGLANVVGGRKWPLSKRVFDVELIMFKKPCASTKGLK